MRALVTGGAGFIGGHLVDRLIAQGDHVTVVDSFATGDYVNPMAMTERTRVEDYEPGTWPDVIYHLASPVGPVGVLRHAGRLAAEVINDASTVAGWAQATGATLIYVSTSELYGPQDGACREDAASMFPAVYSARMEYALAKRTAEVMLLDTSGLDVRIIRPFNVAGPRQKAAGGFVLPRFIAQARAHEPLTVYTPGSQLRSFTHVDDIVDGLLLAARLGNPGRTWNLGNADNVLPIETLASLVLDQLWPDGEYRVVDPRDLWGPAFAEAADKWADASRAQIELGWRPTRNIATIIRDAAYGRVSPLREAA